MANRVWWILVICSVAGCRALDAPTAARAPDEAGRTIAVARDCPEAHLEQTAAASRLPVRTASHEQPSPEGTDSAELPVPTEEVERPSTLGELEQLAMMHNPALAEARAHVVAMRGQWVQVGLPPNTELGYSGQQLASGGVAEQRGLYLQQTFILGHKLRLNRAVAAQEVQRAESLFAAQMQRVLTDVRLQYYAVLVAQRRRETAKDLDRIAISALKTTESLLQADEVSRVDVMRSEVERQNAALRLREAETMLRAARAELAAVVGVPDIAAWGDLVGQLDPVLDDVNPQEVLDRIVTQSPEMSAALSEVERARWAVERAYAEPIPDVDLQAVVQDDRGTGGTNANLQIVLPIPWLDRNQGGIQQAQAELTEAQRAVDRLELALQQRLAPLYQRYQFARSQVEAYTREGGILEKSATTLDLIAQGYAGGELPFLDLVTAQQTNARTNLAYVDALGQYWSAAIEMEGLLLKGSLNSEVHD
jgi:cobalt-zinc-cadmium efflux system outer membrane protein